MHLKIRLYQQYQAIYVKQYALIKGIKLLIKNKLSGPEIQFKKHKWKFRRAPSTKQTKNIHTLYLLFFKLVLD